MSRYYIQNFGKAGIPHILLIFRDCPEDTFPCSITRELETDMSRHDCSRNPSINPLPNLPEHYELEAVTFEIRALRAMHDAMMHQLGNNEYEKSVETAKILLDRLKSCSLTSLMYSAAESLDELKDRPELTLPDLLRELSDPVFGNGIL